jgi:hypothetical protein
MGKHLVRPKKLVGQSGEKVKRTMFGPAKSKKYADIVSLETPSKARESVKQLLHEFYALTSEKKQVKILRVTTLAANRAKATLNRKNLSKKEHEEFQEIYRIYDNAKIEMEVELDLENYGE